MKILAVDTSGFSASVALSDDQVLLEERCLDATGRRHAQTLVLEVDRLLKSCRVRPNQVEAVAVSIGPGSFTGLRVGVVFAKTFAWANSASLVAVDTLQAIAENIGDDYQTVTVISDAQRREVFINDYCQSDHSGHRTPVGEIRVESLESVVAEAVSGDKSASRLVTGPALEKFADEFPAANLLADRNLWYPRASVVAAISARMLAQGELANPDTLEPIYIRRSYAEEKAGK